MEFYNKRANDFSSTRNSVWKCVKDFGEDVTSECRLLDACMGNGKNMIYLKYKTNNIEGFDNCQKFVNICKDRKLKVELGDILNVNNFKEKKYDKIVCIAAIHHLRTHEERIRAVNNLLSLLKERGKILFTVWAYENDMYSSKRKFHKGDNLVDFDGDKRYYYIYDKEDIRKFTESFDVTDKKVYWERGNWNIILTK